MLRKVWQRTLTSISKNNLNRFRKENCQMSLYHYLFYLTSPFLASHKDNMNCPTIGHHEPTVQMMYQKDGKTGTKLFSSALLIDIQMSKLTKRRESQLILYICLQHQNCWAVERHPWMTLQTYKKAVRIWKSCGH